MNRQQRRHPPKPQKPKPGRTKEPQLREMPTFALLAVINEILEVLRERQLEARDWDHKEKVVRKFSSIGGKVYVLATREYPSEVEINGEKQGSEEPSG